MLRIFAWAHLVNTLYMLNIWIGKISFNVQMWWSLNYFWTYFNSSAISRNTHQWNVTEPRITLSEGPCWSSQRCECHNMQGQTDFNLQGIYHGIRRARSDQRWHQKSHHSCLSFKTVSSSGTNLTLQNTIFPFYSDLINLTRIRPSARFLPVRKHPTATKCWCTQIYKPKCVINCL